MLGTLGNLKGTVNAPTIILLRLCSYICDRARKFVREKRGMHL